MGLLMLILGCALPEYDNWYPMLVILTYVFVPLPMTIIKRRNANSMSYSTESDPATDVAMFCTAAIVLSGFGIPFVLWHSGRIVAGAAWLVASGNLVIFSTIAAYFKMFSEDYDSF